MFIDFIFVAAETRQKRRRFGIFPSFLEKDRAFFGELSWYFASNFQACLCKGVVVKGIEGR